MELVQTRMTYISNILYTLRTDIRQFIYRYWIFEMRNGGIDQK